MSDQGSAGGPRPPAPAGASRRRWLWVAVVTVLMIAAFAVGAAIASRTELFPPQVDAAADVVPGPSGGPSPGVDAPQRWEGTFESRSEQWYREGVCRTAWAGALAFTVDDRGRISGDGRAGYGGTSECAVPMAQQVSGFDFSVAGRAEGGRLTMRWSDFTPEGGTVDVGGFGPTIADRGTLITVVLRPEDEGQARLRLRTPTAAGVRPARSETDVTVACVGDC